MLPATTSVASTRPEFRNQSTLKLSLRRTRNEQTGKKAAAQDEQTHDNQNQRAPRAKICPMCKETRTSARTFNLAEAGNALPGTHQLVKISNNQWKPAGKDPGQNFAVFTVTTTVTGAN